MYDAVLIPGGGVREDGILPPWVMPRFDRALELAADACFIPLSAGTTHRPRPLDARGFPITEARAGAAYLMGRGVDPANILMEEASLDTIGNAWFSRTIHVIPRGFERLLVVTSAFHMPRTEAVFRWVYELDAPGPRCTLAFEQTPDAGIDSDEGIARECDRLIREENCEYCCKRETGRLGPVQLLRMPATDFVARFGTLSSLLDGQFKFLPLYRRLWEELPGQPPGMFGEDRIAGELYG